MYKHLGKNINLSFYRGNNYKVFIQGIVAEVTKITGSSNIIVSHFITPKSDKLKSETTNTASSSNKYQLVCSNRSWIDLKMIYEKYPNNYSIINNDIYLINKLQSKEISQSHFQDLFEDYNNNNISYKILYLEGYKEESNDTEKNNGKKTITEIFVEYDKSKKFDSSTKDKNDQTKDKNDPSEKIIKKIKDSTDIFSHYTGLLENTFSDELTLKLDLFPFATNRNLDEEISNLIKTIDGEKPSEKSNNFSDHRLMLFIPEFKALFYKVTNSFAKQIKNKINPQIDGSDSKKNEKNQKENKITPEEKKKLINEIEKITRLYNFKQYFEYINKDNENISDFNELEKKVNELQEETKNKTNDNNELIELTVSVIESIPQAIGDGIVGECAMTKIGFFIPAPLSSDYRRSKKKTYGENPGNVYPGNVYPGNVYLEYYNSMKVIESIFLESPDNKSALVYPLLENGDLFGSLFLLTDNTDLSSLYNIFMDNFRYIQDFTINIKTILNTKFYENAANSILKSSNDNYTNTNSLEKSIKDNEINYPILDFSLNNLHKICNVQLGFYIDKEEIKQKNSVIEARNVISFEKTNGLWGKKTDNKSVSLKDECELKSFLERINKTHSKNSMPFYYQGRLDNFFKKNGFSDYYTTNKKYSNDKIYIGTVVFLPVSDDLNNKKLIIVLFFSEELEVVKNNILTIWQNLSSVFALNQFYIQNKRNEFLKECERFFNKKFKNKNPETNVKISNGWDNYLTKILKEENPHFRNFHINKSRALKNNKIAGKKTNIFIDFLIDTLYAIETDKLSKETIKLLFNILQYFRINYDIGYNISYKTLLEQDYNDQLNFIMSLQSSLKNISKDELIAGLDEKKIIGEKLDEYIFLTEFKNERYKNILILINYLIKYYKK